MRVEVIFLHIQSNQNVISAAACKQKIDAVVFYI